MTEPDEAEAGAGEEKILPRPNYIREPAINWRELDEHSPWL
jgi:hypothetical protein